MNRLFTTLLMLTTITTATAPLSGAKIEDFSLPSATSRKVVRLSDYPGKVVLVNVWRTTCGWCKREKPKLIALERKYRSQGLVVIGVALESPASLKTLPSYLRNHGITWPIVLNDLAEFYARFGRKVKGLPGNFLVSRDRQVKFLGSDRSESDWQKLESNVREALAQPAPRNPKRKNLRRIPQLNLSNLGGQSVALKQFVGKPTIIHFFSRGNGHWSGKAMGDFHRKYSARGLQVVGVALRTKKDALRQYVRKYDVRYPVLIGTKRVQRELLQSPKTWGVIFIDSRGRVVKKFEVAYRGLEKRIYPWYIEYLLQNCHGEKCIVPAVDQKKSRRAAPKKVKRSTPIRPTSQRATRLDAGRYRRLLATLDKNVRQNPRDVLSLILRGALRQQMRELDKAVADFTAALRLTPQSPALWHLRGITYLSQGKHQKAIADFDEAIRRKPDYNAAIRGKRRARAKLRAADMGQ